MILILCVRYRYCIIIDVFIIKRNKWIINYELDNKKWVLISFEIDNVKNMLGLILIVFLYLIYLSIHIINIFKIKKKHLMSK